MDEKALITKALQDLNQPDPKVDISASVEWEGWRVTVNGQTVCVISEEEKDALMAHLKDYNKADLATQKAMIMQMFANTKAFLEKKLVELG